jgi:hypothetical protein
MRFLRFCILGILVASWAATGWAEEFRLANGNTMVGRIASADEDGMVIWREDIGQFSTRQPWVSFSQETLRRLRQNPDLADFVEIFIELTPEEIDAMTQTAEIIVRDVGTRIPRPSPVPSLLGGFVSPIGFLLLLLLVAGNLYAAFEVAQFRNQNVALVCGISFILPIVGPIIFLSLPTDTAEAAPAEAPAEDLAASSMAMPSAAERAAGGLSLASAEKTAASEAHSQPQIFQRGEHTFNRRFFETKFPGFFRVVLGEAERDLVLVFRTPKQEFLAKRISRISMNELHLVLLAGGEKSISFSEITSVILKHKDAKV